MYIRVACQVITVVVAIAALGVLGCGSGGGSASGPGPAEASFDQVNVYDGLTGQPIAGSTVQTVTGSIPTGAGQAPLLSYPNTEGEPGATFSVKVDTATPPSDIFTSINGPSNNYQDVSLPAGTVTSYIVNMPIDPASTEGTAVVTVGWKDQNGVVSQTSHYNVTIGNNPLQMVEGLGYGKYLLPESDSQSGGQGQVVDGINCNAEVEYHIHAHLVIFHNGQQIALPEGIGIPNTVNGKQNGVNAGGFTFQAPCTYWLHTHDHSGIVHVEAPAVATYTLGQFFDIWGYPLSTSQVATLSGPVTVYVNGQQYTGDPRAITLTPYKQITLEVGTPLVPPPQYVWPPDF